MRYWASLAVLGWQTRRLGWLSDPASCSTYLGHCGDVVTSFLRSAGASKVLFIPWALKDWDKYFANPASIAYGAPTHHC